MHAFITKHKINKRGGGWHSWMWRLGVAEKRRGRGSVVGEESSGRGQSMATAWGGALSRGVDSRGGES
jgi:hypothetical protein